MGRDSRSPSFRTSRHREDLRDERDGYSSRRRSEKGYDGRASREDRPSRDDYYSRRSRRDGDIKKEDDERYGYSEREREKERERDRERYDSGAREGGRDRDRGYNDRSHRTNRRSASPPSRTSRPRSPSGSAPRSPTEKDRAKPNFAPSGLLAAETNTVKAADGTKTVLKYNEPPEARKPVVGWRLYVFKDNEQVELLHIHRQSAYLIGRDRLVADIPVEHPSCSKQHAVIQYRYIRERNEFGDAKGVIKPFIIDLESTNGTHVNGEQIPAARYYELRASDVIKFGLSTKEYVLLHDDAT